MMTSSKLLALISTLASNRPFRLEDVSRLTGASLQPDASVSNEYFTVYSSGSGTESTFQKVELRVPASKATKGGLVLFELAPATCVTQDEAKRHFGQSPVLSVPTPRQPPESPIYLKYSRPWGELRLGFSRGAKSCMVSVVIDSNE